MKSIIPLLSLAATIAASAGCSTVTPAAPALSPARVQTGDRIDKKKKPYEILKATHISVETVECNPSGLAGVAEFSASGTAKGRVKGKFTMVGGWNFAIVGSQTVWNFSESFEIKGKHPKDGGVTGSGTGNISTCKKFGPVTGGSDLTYHLGKKAGDATTNSLKDGGTLLQQLH
ncbi:MAG TPA: hypothetical protein VMU38_04735 [Candidatus Binatia bacterium]|nr:hypothetical protein [Candidatus Binatia bacterium]